MDHWFVLCSLLWTLIYIKWLTFLCKWHNYSNTFFKKLRLFWLLYYHSQFVKIWVLQSITTEIHCSSVQWKALSVFIDHDAAHKYVVKLLCYFVWWGRRSTEKLVRFLMKGSRKNCTTVKIFFFFPTSDLQHWKAGADIFLFLLIVHVTSVPNLCKSFAVRTVLHKNVIAVTCNGKVFPLQAWLWPRGWAEV